MQRKAPAWEAFVARGPGRLLIAAILVVNNVRDIDTDRRAGKRTLAVRLGRERTRMLFAAMVAAAFVSSWVPWIAGALSPWLFVTLAAAPLAFGVVQTVRTHADGPSLNVGARAHREAGARLLPAALRRRAGLSDGALVLERVVLRFATPLATAYGALRDRELIEVTLTDDDGLRGRGEAAPLEPYDGVSIERVLAALEAYRAVARRRAARA